MANFQIAYEEVGAGEGYASKVLKVDITFEDDGEDYCVALKLPCVSKALRELVEETEGEDAKGVLVGFL